MDTARFLQKADSGSSSNSLIPLLSTAVACAVSAPPEDDAATIDAHRAAPAPEPLVEKEVKDIDTAVENPLRRFGATAAGEKELDTKKDLPGIIFFLSFRRTSDQTPPEKLPLRALGAKDTILLLFLAKKTVCGFNIESLFKSLFKPIEVSMATPHKTLCQHIDSW